MYERTKRDRQRNAELSTSRSLKNANRANVDWFNASLLQGPSSGDLGNADLNRVPGQQFSTIVIEALAHGDSLTGNKFRNARHSSYIPGVPTENDRSRTAYSPSVRVPRRAVSVNVNPPSTSRFREENNLRSASNPLREESRIRSIYNSDRGNQDQESSMEASKSNIPDHEHYSRNLKPAPSCPGIPLAQIKHPSHFLTSYQPPKQSVWKSLSQGVSTHDLRENNPDSMGLYRMADLIGTGNFSQVRLATHLLTRELVAIKILEKFRMNAATRKLLFREISILDKLHHPNIVRLYEVIETLTRLHLIMEYVPGGDLNKRIERYGKFTEAEAKIIFAQLIAAVNHLHQRNIFHRDIKADNILFTHRLPAPSCSTLCSMESTTDGTHEPRVPIRTRFKDSGCRKQIRRMFRQDSRDKARRIMRTKSENSRVTSGQRENDIFVKFSKCSFWTRDRKRSQSNNRFEKTVYRKSSLGFHQQASKTEICPEYYRIKLADFGFSKMALTADQELNTCCGSPAYAAPELFEAQSYQGGPVDMWAVGIVLFLMLTGLLPYRGTTVGHVRRLILENRGMQPPAWISPAATSLYLKLTARLPQSRLKANELLEAASAKSVVVSNSCSPTKELWSTWLRGEVFPKAFPRFSQSAPLLCSSEQRDERPATRSPTPLHPSKPTLTRQDTATSQLSGQLTPTSNGTPVLGDDMESDVDSEDMTNGTVRQDELQAVRQLMELGVTEQEMAASKNLESRSAVTGAYRILLHRVQRERRLSDLNSEEPFDKRSEETEISRQQTADHCAGDHGYKTVPKPRVHVTDYRPSADFGQRKSAMHKKHKPCSLL